MCRFLRLGLSASLAGASLVQHPLTLPVDGQVPLKSNEGKPLVSSSALQADVSRWHLFNRANSLFEIAKLGSAEYGHPTRVIGSAGHLGTIDYIYSTLSQHSDYYDFSTQVFNATVGNVFESQLVLGGEISKSAQAMGLSPPTKDREPVFGSLVYVTNSGCRASDFPSEVKGNIALIRRGTCNFGQKSEFAGKAGAIAAVIFNTENGTLSGTLSDPKPEHIATFAISKEEAIPLMKKLRDGEDIKTSAYIDAIVRITGTTNIIAQTKQGDAENCVMLGGHSDSVDAGPGINDDGSGSLTLLELATLLTKYSVNNCVRFAWWAGEEEGLLGSDYYVETLSKEENLKIRLFMDYDMLASPNFAYQVYNATDKVNPAGSEELRDLYTEFYKSNDLNYTYIPFDGRSDYDAFIKHGIPGGGIATGAEGIKTKEEEEMFGGHAGRWYDECYHQLCDTVDNLDFDAWEINTKLVAHSIATYAVSFKNFPKRTSIESARWKDIKFARHGPKFVM